MNSSKKLRNIVRKVVKEEIDDIVASNKNVDPINGLTGLTKVGVKKTSPFEGIVSIEWQISHFDLNQQKAVY